MLRDWGAQLLHLLDQDGAHPDERDPREGNELRLARDPHGGGWVKGRFTDAAMYDQIAALIDAKSAPLTADDQRPLEQRQAEAMAEIFGWVAAHGDTTVAPTTGGRRPQVNVLIRLEDLQNRAHAACLEFGGTLHPAELRRLCCDAGVIPIVFSGAGQPLDVGRQARTVPDGMRRAVTARDRGCAHPGCTRPPSWCEIHHIREWELGGDTALSNLVMLCSVHHREIHSSGWTVRIAPDGLPEFIPTAVDRYRAESAKKSRSRRYRSISTDHFNRYEDRFRRAPAKAGRRGRRRRDHPWVSGQDQRVWSGTPIYGPPGP